ncbi:MAG: PDZ domain-containing protein [Dehalococcoidales bacterium]|nr:PDZ domain-containing protein [Dehalococcoidales bacterium]
MGVSVKVYTTPSCGYCHQLKRYLDSLGVKYTEYDVSRDSTALDELVGLTGQLAVPVTVIDGEVVVGFDPGRIGELLLAGRGQKVRFGLRVADAVVGGERIGAFVGEVATGSPSERAGIRPGDVITAINGMRVNGASMLADATSSLSPGDTVVIEFLRNGQGQQTEVVL